MAKLSRLDYNTTYTGTFLGGIENEQTGIIEPKVRIGEFNYPIRRIYYSKEGSKTNYGSREDALNRFKKAVGISFEDAGWVVGSPIKVVKSSFKGNDYLNVLSKRDLMQRVVKAKNTNV